MLRTVHATRYVTPLREGGSLPAIVEADDEGLYVLKFRGAGQGPLALVAEVIAGEIGRVLGLRVPELVTMEVDSALGRNEPDEEIRDLLEASTGLNLGLDYLPGALMFDPAAGDSADPTTASTAVWFDSFVGNVDRTARNPNLLWWHKSLYFIDHGTSLIFQHNWCTAEANAVSPFARVGDHVLLPWATEIAAVDPGLWARLGMSIFSEILAMVPNGWLTEDRSAYVRYLSARLQAASSFVEEALRARAELV
jgi:hypothetical protein